MTSNTASNTASDAAARSSRPEQSRTEQPTPDAGPNDTQPPNAQTTDRQASSSAENASSQDEFKPRPVPDAEYLAALKAHSDRLESAEPHEIIRWAVEEFGARLTMGTAFGPEGMWILHMLSDIDRNVNVFNLETGYQFAETLALRDQVEERYGIDVKLKKPELSVEEYERANGGPLYKTRPDQCCFDRKIRVLHRAIEGSHAWISAIRRDQSEDRRQADIVGWDKKFGLVKVNPLANTTSKQVWGEIMKHKIPYNPLHDKGYSSVGCWPCTRAVMAGEDERAGRWSGSEKTECGLHSIE